MSDGVKFKIEGLEEVRKLCLELPKRVGTRMRRTALKRAAELFLADMQGTSQWADRTGNLRGSMRTRPRNNKGSAGLVIDGLLYGRYLEFGWVSGSRSTSRQSREQRTKNARSVGTFHAPRPWVRPVFETRKDQAIRLIIEDLQKEIEAVFSKYGAK